MVFKAPKLLLLSEGTDDLPMRMNAFRFRQNISLREIYRVCWQKSRISSTYVLSEYQFSVFRTNSHLTQFLTGHRHDNFLKSHGREPNR